MPAKAQAQVTRAPVISSSMVENRDDSLRWHWMRVVDAVAAQAGHNPKLHALGDLALSFLENGFVDPPKWDENLNNGQGGIVYGNGRIEALAWLEQMHRTGQPLFIGGEEVPPRRPRGVGTERGTGAWVIQVGFGVDAESAAQAARLLIDHNNLTMAGGGFTALDMSRMYDQTQYLLLLEGIESGLAMAGDERLLDGGQITLTVDTADFKLLTKEIAEAQEGDLLLGAERLTDDEGERVKAEGQSAFAMATLKLAYNPEHYGEAEEMINALMPWLDATNPADCVLKALRYVAEAKGRPSEAA